MWKLFRKGINALDERNEKQEEKIAHLLDRHVDAMGEHATLKRYVLVLSSINITLWASVLIFPYEVYKAFETVGEIDDRVVMTIVAAVFGVGMWLTYALFRMRLPNLEEREFDSDFLSTVEYQRSSYRRFHVWLGAVGGGVLNLLGLFIVELALLEFWYRP